MEKTTLGRFAEIIMGQSPKSEYYNAQGIGMPFLQGNRTFGRKYPYFDTYTEKAIKVAEAGDVIMSVRAPVGDINITPRQMCLGRGVCSIRARNGKQNFLYYLMRYKVRQLIARENGTVFGSVNFNDISSLEIELPTDIDQERIGSMLAQIDDNIENNCAINDNLQQQIQSLYDSWFKHFAPFSDSEFVVNELGRIPLCWNVSDIYSIATVIYGAPYSSDLFNTEGNGKPIVRIRDLKEQSLSTFTTEVHPKGYLLQLGDIVVGMDGEFRPYIWGNDEAWLNQRVCVFANKRQQGKAFLLCVLRPLLDYVEKTEVGTTVIHIGKKDFDGFRIVLPPDDVLDRFDAIVEPMYWQIVENLYQNRRLAALRDALLPKLMSGEIDVSEVEF